MPFVKLDCGILDSSLWMEPPETRIVFLTMLAMTEPSGLCPATAPGISRRANLSLPVVEKALAVLEAPDPHSRSLEAQGRRIERVDGGYHMVNYLRYRAWSYSDSPEAVRKRKYRAEKKDTPDTGGTCPGQGGTCPDVSASASSSASKSKGKGYGEGDVYPPAFEAWWSRYPLKTAKGDALGAWKARLREGRTPEELGKALDNYLVDLATLGTEEQYIKRGATFLGKRKGFLDYLPGTWKPAPAGGNRKRNLTMDEKYPRVITEAMKREGRMVPTQQELQEAGLA